MPDLQTLLDQIDQLDQQATKGSWHVATEEDEDGSKFPWAIFGPRNDLWGAQGWDHEHYVQEIPELTIPDAEFIALARIALPQLAQALRAVIADCDEIIEDAAKYGMADRHLMGQGAQARATCKIITDALGADHD